MLKIKLKIYSQALSFQVQAETGDKFNKIRYKMAEVNYGNNM